MSRWFCFCDAAIIDPKVPKLSDRHHRTWIGLLYVAKCLLDKAREGFVASLNKRVIPMIEDDRTPGVPKTNSSSLPLGQGIERWLPEALPVASHSAEPDPMHAEIKRCREAKRRFEEACAKADQTGEDYDDHTNSLSSAFQDSFGELVETVPTTIAGLIETIIFDGEVRKSHPYTFDEVDIRPTLRIAAARLRGRSLS
jgi:hypothetical protein